MAFDGANRVKNVLLLDWPGEIGLWVMILLAKLAGFGGCSSFFVVGRGAPMAGVSQLIFSSQFPLSELDPPGGGSLTNALDAVRLLFKSEDTPGGLVGAWYHPTS